MSAATALALSRVNDAFVITDAGRPQKRKPTSFTATLGARTCCSEKRSEKSARSTRERRLRDADVVLLRPPLEPPPSTLPSKKATSYESYSASLLGSLPTPGPKRHCAAYFSPSR